MFLLSLSPHYFYGRDRRAEAERNRVSRQRLVDDVLLEYLRPSARVLDYGCGPGYMAAAVARYVQEVEAIDVSDGVLQCARVLNGAPNIRYLTPAEAGRRTDPIDVAYSFAVVQHLSDAVLAGTLELLRRRVRPGGALLLHFPQPDDTWRTEDAWRSDASLKGRAKLRFGLHCFGRPDDQLVDMVVAAGFKDACTHALKSRTSVDDDVTHQRLLVARG